MSSILSFSAFKIMFKSTTHGPYVTYHPTNTSKTSPKPATMEIFTYTSKTSPATSYALTYKLSTLPTAVIIDYPTFNSTTSHTTATLDHISKNYKATPATTDYLTSNSTTAPSTSDNFMYNSTAKLVTTV